MSTIQEKDSPQPSSAEKRTIKLDWNFLILILASAVFVFNCLNLDLTQDDAYISFRYAANYVNGEGLVYNHGERVEGYTNFLWVMLLALFKGIFGINYLFASRLIGIVSGVAIFPLLYLLLKQHFKDVPVVLHLSLVLAMLSNFSLPYWSIASLETSAFACAVLAAIVAEHRRPQLTPALLVIATLLRPEGAIVFAAILINRMARSQGLIWYSVIMYAALLLPFALFKLVYYGSLLPNSYYAKSGIGLEYIQGGLEYFWRFTRTIGVYGIIFLVPLLAVKRLWHKYSLL
jgi:arabinofuranosyltransferase